MSQKVVRVVARPSMFSSLGRDRAHPVERSRAKTPATSLMQILWPGCSIDAGLNPACDLRGASNYQEPEFGGHYGKLRPLREVRDVLSNGTFLVSCETLWATVKLGVPEDEVGLLVHALQMLGQRSRKRGDAIGNSLMGTHVPKLFNSKTDVREEFHRPVLH